VPFSIGRASVAVRTAIRADARVDEIAGLWPASLPIVLATRSAQYICNISPVEPFDKVFQRLRLAVLALLSRRRVSGDARPCVARVYERSPGASGHIGELLPGDRLLRAHEIRHELYGRVQVVAAGRRIERKRPVEGMRPQVVGKRACQPENPPQGHVTCPVCEGEALREQRLGLLDQPAFLGVEATVLQRPLRSRSIRADRACSAGEALSAACAPANSGDVIAE